MTPFFKLQAFHLSFVKSHLPLLAVLKCTTTAPGVPYVGRSGAITKVSLCVKFLATTAQKVTRVRIQPIV